MTFLALAMSAALFLANRALGQYVDESDNLVGGVVIAHGFRLYVDYFSQHMPLPYFVAAVPALLGGWDLQVFRVFFASLIVLAQVYVLLQFRKHLPPVFFWALFLLLGIGHPIYSGHMFLADGFFAMALLVLALFVITKPALNFSRGEQVAISASYFVALQSTLISIYPLALLGGYYVLRRVVVPLYRKKSVGWREVGVFAVLLSLPHLVLGAVLMAQGGWAAFFDQAVRFNQVYYSRYELAGDPVSILFRSGAEYIQFLATFLRPSAWREVETYFIIANLGATIVLWRRSGWGLAVLYSALVMLARMRGAGYHGAPYFVLSFASAALMLSSISVLAFELARQWHRQQAFPQISPRHAAVALMGIAFMMLSAHFLRDIGGFYWRLPRGEGLESRYADAVMAATEPTDRTWAAPFEPYVYLKAQRLPATTYHYYHPWLADSPEVTDGLLQDLAREQPPVLVFRSDKRIDWTFPVPTPGEFGARVYALIRQNYEPADPTDPELKDVYLRRDSAETLRARMVQHGVIRGR